MKSAVATPISVIALCVDAKASGAVVGTEDIKDPLAALRAACALGQPFLAVCFCLPAHFVLLVGVCCKPTMGGRSMQPLVGVDLLYGLSNNYGREGRLVFRS